MNHTQKLVCEISGYEPNENFTSARNDNYYTSEDKKEMLREFCTFVDLDLSKADTEKAYSFLESDIDNENDRFHEFSNLTDIS